MTMIFMKDSLRKTVEAASGGKRTVIYTKKNQPCFMNIIQKFDLSEYSENLSGTHPAFIIDGEEKEELFIGSYLGTIQNGELLSIPNSDPTRNQEYSSFYNAIKANGAGWHLTSNTEMAALSLISNKANFTHKGNTDYGCDAHSREPGLFVDKLNPQTTFTGSGGSDWRHDNTYAGISDFTGNLSVACSGVRVVGGELQITADNNSAKFIDDMYSTTNENWKAIDGRTGKLIEPKFVGSVDSATGSYIDYIPTTQNSIRIKTPDFTPPMNNSVYFLGADYDDYFRIPVFSNLADEAKVTLRKIGFYPMVEGVETWSIFRSMTDLGANLVAKGPSFHGVADVRYRGADCIIANVSIKDITMGARPAFYK